MALYKDGNPVSGLNSIPRLTLAQYNALNVKPEFWVRTDAPESYKKLSADQVSYDSNNTVKDKIDEIENNAQIVTGTLGTAGGDTVFNYPTGFNQTNCMIASLEYKVDNNRFDILPNYNYQNIATSLRNYGIIVYLGSDMTGLANKDIKILLIKP